MTLKTIRDLRDRAPFRPFDLHLAEGEVLTVPTPDHLFFVPESIDVIVGLVEGGFRIVDTTQIVSAGRVRPRAKSH